MLLDRDGNWAGLGAWGNCTAECGGGIQTRERACQNTASAEAGVMCLGGNTETRKCNVQQCLRE